MNPEDRNPGDPQFASMAFLWPALAAETASSLASVVAREFADAALNAVGQIRGGEEARLIGEVREEPAGAVLVTTSYGGSRIVDMLVGDPLPRIC